MAVYSLEGVFESLSQLKFADLRRAEGTITYCFPSEPSIYGEHSFPVKNWAYVFTTAEQFKRFMEEMKASIPEEIISKKVELHIDTFIDEVYAIRPL